MTADTSTRPLGGAGSPTVPRSSRLAVLDGYRAVAAVLVVITHVAFVTGWTQRDAVGRLASRFDWGVTIFFLLSGFLLYRPWARAAMTGGRPPALAAYFWRRALRILPAYWLLVVVVLLFLPVALHPGDATTWATYLLLGQTYSSRPLVEGLTHTWSLGAEISFYVALPVLAWAVTRRGRGDVDQSTRAQLVGLGVLALVGLAVTVLRAQHVLSDLRWGFWLPAFLDWFALGMAGAVLFERRALGGEGRAVRRVLGWADDTVACLAIAVAVLVVCATPVAGGYVLDPAPAWSVVARHVLYGVAAAAFLAPGALGHRDDTWHRALTAPVPQAMGRWSYGIFLWHLAVMWVLVEVTHLVPFTGGAWWLLPATVVLATGVAALSWRLVERPASRLRRWVPARR
jgi:peptidoglycan/LPS O-acetylase OafA/YrhL